MSARKKQFYLMVYLGPTGLSWTRIEITHKKPNPRRETRGEGQCLVFRMVDYDCSTNFHEAMLDGTLMADIGNKRYELDLSSWLTPPPPTVDGEKP